MTDEQLRKAFEIAHHKFNGITPRWINIRGCYAYSTHQYCFEWFKRGAESVRPKKMHPVWKDSDDPEYLKAYIEAQEEAITEVMENEREACAQACEIAGENYKSYSKDIWFGSVECAAAIRARNKT